MKLPRLIHSASVAGKDAVIEILRPEGETGALRIAVDSIPLDHRVHGVATEIARRCNAHDELVGALRSALHIIHAHNIDAPKTIEVCDRALALAGGEEVHRG